jgi:hypothetical protein
VEQEIFQEEDLAGNTLGASGGRPTLDHHRGEPRMGVMMEGIQIMIMIIRGTREEEEIGKHRNRG